MRSKPTPFLTHVSFQTDLFNTVEQKDTFVNPDLFGDDLAEWLRSRLGHLPFEIKDPLCEDWGWCLLPRGGEDEFIIGIHFCEEMKDGSGYSMWGIFVEPLFYLNFIKKLLNKFDRDRLKQLCDAINQALTNEPRVRNVQWIPEDKYPLWPNKE